MPEMSCASEYHDNAVFVGRRDHLFVAHRATGLDHGFGTGFREYIESVTEGEEGIGGDTGIVERESG